MEEAPYQTPAPRGQGPRLSEWLHATIELSCTRCGRAGSFVVAELRAALPGGDMAITFLRDYLTEGCVARRVAQNINDLCQAELRAPRRKNGTPGE